MKLYVGNLAYNVSEDQLRDLFARFGTPDSARVITDRDSGQSKGFGFVEFSDDQAAKQANANPCSLVAPRVEGLRPGLRAQMPVPSAADMRQRGGRPQAQTAGPQRSQTRP